MASGQTVDSGQVGIEATLSATDSGKADSHKGEGQQQTMSVRAAEATVDGKWADSGQWASGRIADGGG